MTITDPRKLAGVGPLALKDPDSVEYAWQLTDKIRRLYETKELTIQQWEQALEDAEKHRIYERVPPEHPYGALDTLLEAEIGVNKEQSIGDVKLRGRGRPKKEGGDKDYNIIFNSSQSDGPARNQGDSAAYLTARIARDRPDILKRMQAGEYKSVRAAAMDAGIVQPRISIPADVEGAARILRQKFKGKDYERLVDLLAQCIAVDV